MLNKLGRLRDLFISDLFGMATADCLLPVQVPNLEYLYLNSVPHEYASAMQSWRRLEVANGTSVSITKARKPEWVQENRQNPLRDWGGREHIGPGRFKRAVAQFKKTRSDVFEALSAKPCEATLRRLEDVGRDYASAFNRLDGRSPFTETKEPEELFAALDNVMAESELELGRSLVAEWLALLSGVEGAREW
ncbi:hypothetical protein OHC50_12510 [Paenarthrobacter ilicis]|uniref:hypothetical protein n=1 Tax=Paenarthrobacter ilicis TaxID=43665 RepID=UPI0030090C62